MADQEVWCVEVCDYEACWYERIYDSEEEAQKHADNYKLVDHEKSVSVVMRKIDNTFRA